MERVEPDKVKLATECYMRENDIFKQFETQCVFDNPKVKLTVVALYNHFKEWFREECPGQVLPTRTVVKKHFLTKWGDLVDNKYWVGKTCKQESEGEEKGNPLL